MSIPTLEKPAMYAVSNPHDASSGELKDGAHVAGDLGLATARAAHREPRDDISDEHRQYLLRRHGTWHLEPRPSPSDADPYNWPQWKKVTNLLLVAFHACMSTFTAAAIIPAYPLIAKDLHIAVQTASYLTSLQILIIGVAPLLWRPISTRYGRRPVFLLSLVLSMATNIACGFCYTYASMAACRALVALFISPASAIGSAVVTETFFKAQRAKYMGVWTLMVTLGVPLSPFIFGFVTVRVGYRWIFFVLAITNAVQFLLYLFLGPETRYIRQGDPPQGSALKREYLQLRRIDPSPFALKDFVYPLKFFAHANVVIPAAAYGMVFLLTGVLVTVELPQLFAEKFAFDAQALGLQFLGIIIGSILGEQVGGYASDFWMSRRQTVQKGVRPRAEFRLWLSYLGYVLGIAGYVVFLVQIEDAPELHWNVTPVVGAAVAAAGNQIVTTVLITYAVDCHPDDSASVGVFITFVRQVWGFIGPFWFPQMFESVGLKISAAIGAVLMIAVSILPTLYLQFVAKKKA